MSPPTKTTSPRPQVAQPAPQQAQAQPKKANELLKRLQGLLSKKERTPKHSYEFREAAELQPLIGNRGLNAVLTGEGGSPPLGAQQLGTTAQNPSGDEDNYITGTSEPTVPSVYIQKGSSTHGSASLPPELPGNAALASSRQSRDEPSVNSEDTASRNPPYSPVGPQGYTSLLTRGPAYSDEFIRGNAYIWKKKVEPFREELGISDERAHEMASRARAAGENVLKESVQRARDRISTLQQKATTAELSPSEQGQLAELLQKVAKLEAALAARQARDADDDYVPYLRTRIVPFLAGQMTTKLGWGPAEAYGFFGKQAPEQLGDATGSLSEGAQEVRQTGTPSLGTYFKTGTTGSVPIVRELDQGEREAYRVHGQGGSLAYGLDKAPLDTGKWRSNWAGPGWGIYVMDQAGNFYAGPHKVSLFHHSTFLAGGEVAGAGELKAVQGKLVGITNKSGHYAPAAEEAFQVLHHLKSAWGIDLGGVEFTYYSGRFPNGVKWQGGAAAFYETFKRGNFDEANRKAEAMSPSQPVVQQSTSSGSGQAPQPAPQPAPANAQGDKRSWVPKDPRSPSWRPRNERR
jgi:hypothetical protein